MILVAAIVVSIVIGLLRGGRFNGLAAVPLCCGALAVVAFAAQALFIYQTPSRKAIGVWGWQELIFVGSHLLLLVTVWANRHLEGVRLIGLGLLLNLVVMVTNGGWMPITPEALIKVGHAGLVPSLASGMRIYSSKNMLLSPQETKLWLLSDVFVLPRPFPVPSVFSVGDVLVALGAFFLIQSAMLGQHSPAGPTESISKSKHSS